MALFTCSGCARHVRRTETACPFCGAALDLSARPERPLPRARLNRSAAFAFGVIGAQLAGCADTTTPTDAGMDVRDLGDTPVYGGPDVPVTTDAPIANDVGTDGGPAPLYGGPPDAPSENDAGTDVGGVAPLYGGSPGS